MSAEIVELTPELVDALKRSRRLRHQLTIIEDREKCEASLAEFVRQAWHVIEPGTPLVWNWHIDVLCAYLEAFFTNRIKRLILNVPPGSLKSVLVSVMGPAWKWAKHPSARLISITNEIGLATRDSMRMRQVITSDWYQERWGEKFSVAKDQREKTHFANSKRGFRQSLGVTSSITGKRGSFLLLDDLVDAKKAFSDVIIQAANETFDQAISSRLNDLANDGICLIMQRLRTNDLTGHLLGKKSTKWTHVRIPMRWDGEQGFDPVADLGPEYAHLADPRTKRGELMFPQRFTEEVVKSLEEDLGEYGAAGQLQQRPSPLGGGILKAHWWRTWGQFGWTKGRSLPYVKHVFASWDTAFSEKDIENAAYSAMTLWGVFWDEDAEQDALILLSSWWGRVDYPDLKAKAIEITKTKLTNMGDAHLIERKASGISLIQSLKRDPRIRVRSYTPVAGEDKVARAYMVQPVFQRGLVYVPDKEWAQDTIRLIAEFPAGGPPCADLTDTVTQAIQYLLRGWWITHPDDTRDDAPDERKTTNFDTDWAEDSEESTALGYG